MEAVAKTETLRTDSVKADEIRAKLTPLLTDVGLIFDKAIGDGLIVSFSINRDQFGRSKAEVTITKPL